MPIEPQNESIYVCKFCGNQRFENGSCSGCGGSSFIRESENPYLNNLHLKLVKQFVEANKYLKILTAVVAIGFLALVTANYHNDPRDDPQDKTAPTKKVLIKKGHTPVGVAWSTILNPEKIAPESGFTAYYLRGGPENVVYKEQVNSIGIKYVSADNFHSISPNSLAAFWVGKITVPKKGFYDFFLSKSHASVRVFINGSLQNLNSSQGKSILELEKGEHLIEVEFRNYWHTTDFSFSYSETTPEYSKSAIHSKLTNLINGEYEFLYASQNKSPSQNRTTLLNLEKRPGPVVLMLSSSNPINWHISNPFDVDVKAVVYGSYKAGSVVAGDIDADTPIFNHGQRLIRKGRRKCFCSSKTLRCKDNSLVDFEEQMKEYGTGLLSGISVNHSTNTLLVPEITINSKAKDKEARDYAVLEQKCLNSPPETEFQKKRAKVLEIPDMPTPTVLHFPSDSGQVLIQLKGN